MQITRHEISINEPVVLSLKHGYGILGVFARNDRVFLYALENNVAKRYVEVEISCHSTGEFVPRGKFPINTVMVRASQSDVDLIIHFFYKKIYV